MAKINIPTSGLWTSIASALNNNFDDLYSATGWGNYGDDEFTVSNTFDVTAGSTLALPNNKANVIESYLPTGVTTLYDGSRIRPENVGDGYDVRFSFTAESSSTSGAFIASLDISAAGDGSNIVASKAGIFLKGANTPQPFTETISVFSLSTFVTNGAVLRIESVTGTTRIYGISYYIKRDHKAL